MAFLLLATSAFFAVDGTMEANGWRCARPNEQDAFTVKNGELTAVCSPSPYKGVSYVRTVDFPRNGELSFEVRTFLDGYNQSNRYFLQVCLGPLMISFVENDMIRYFERPKPNWKSVARNRIRAQEWTKIRIVWNTDERMIAYYAGEMTIPAAVEEDAVIDVNGPTAEFRIGNYGLSRAFERHQLRNFDIRPKAAEAETDTPRDLALVFNGLSSEFFPIKSWTKEFPSDRIIDFTLNYNGLNYRTVNDISLSAVPDRSLCRRAKLIILADLPLEKRVLSYKAQENLLQAVREGAHMIVTGGLAGLEKCGDFDAPIARALPVKLTDPWHLPEGGKKVRCNYGKGTIVVLNTRKAHATHEDE